MKLLYLSCHETLEYDEVTMFLGMGHSVFSVGAYLQPQVPTGQQLRSPIRGAAVDRDDLAEFWRLCPTPEDCVPCLTQSFLDRFDAVIVMHRPDWVEATT